jgi:hypothetical protein
LQNFWLFGTEYDKEHQRYAKCQKNPGIVFYWKRDTKQNNLTTENIIHKISYEECRWKSNHKNQKIATKRPFTYTIL